MRDLQNFEGGAAIPSMLWALHEYKVVILGRQNKTWRCPELSSDIK